MSAGLLTCPTCQAMLKVPAGAAAIRCPQCKTVLEIESPNPAPVAPPLPFGPTVARPKAPSPQSPPPRPKAPPLASTAPKPGKIRASIVDEEAEEAEARDRAAAEKKAEAREALRELNRENERYEEEFAYLSETCKHGRTALALLLYGMRAYAVAMMLIAAAGAAFLLVPELAATTLISSLVIAQIGTILIGVGFGFAIFGPDQGRFLGTIGLLTVITQVGMVVIVLAKLLSFILGYDATRITGYADALVGFHAIGLATYTPMLADTPTRIIMGYEFSILGMVVGAIEFTRLVLVCQVTQLYADVGKEPELGHKSFVSVSNFFWVILLGAMFRMAASFGFDWAPRGEMLFTIGQTIHAVVLLAILEIGGLIVLNQSMIMERTKEYVDPNRYILKGERLVE